MSGMPFITSITSVIVAGRPRAQQVAKRPARCRANNAAAAILLPTHHSLKLVLNTVSDRQPSASSPHQCRRMRRQLQAAFPASSAKGSCAIVIIMRCGEKHQFLMPRDDAETPGLRVFVVFRKHLDGDRRRPSIE